MSKWKYVRKERLETFQAYEWVQGLLTGASITLLIPGSYSTGIGAGVAFLLVVIIHWYSNSNNFTRIRKAINDAGGGSE